MLNFCITKYFSSDLWRCPQGLKVAYTTHYVPFKALN